MSGEINQTLEDLDVDSSDMMDNPKAFIIRMYAKSKDLAAQLDSKSSMSEHERLFKVEAYKNEAAKEKAQEIFEHFSTIISEQEPEVLVNLLTLFPELTSMAQSSVRSMSMRTSGTATLSKKQINLLYIKLKKTYETYINYMKLFQADKIGIPPVIVAKKGNYSDYSGTSGIKTFEFIIDNVSYINPFSVAKKLDLTVKHYMDLPEILQELLKDDPDKLINGHTVKLVDISTTKDEEEETK